MPKIFMDATKGLYQTAGLGWNIKPQTAPTPAAGDEIVPTSAMLIVDLSATNAGGADAATIQDGVAGDVVIIVNSHATTSGEVEGATIGAGEAAMFVYTGSKWAFLAN